jgi:hypothetical protein
MSEGDNAPKKWRLVYQDETYDESALTMAEAETIEEFLGLSWLMINPVRSAKQARGVLAVLHAARTGRPRDEVFAELGDMTTEQFVVGCLSFVDDDIPGSFIDGFPPVATAARSTGTSSGSTGRRSTGPRRSPGNSPSETSS